MVKKDNYWSIRKFIDDTLKEPDGKWSMKRMSVAGFLPLVTALSIYIVVSDKVLDDKVVNPYAIQVLTTLITFVAVALGMTVWDKIANSKSDTYSETTTTEIKSNINPDEPIN